MPSAAPLAAGGGARELEIVAGHVQVRRLDGQLERNHLVERETAADARQLAGGQVTVRQLRDDRVLGLAEAERQRLGQAMYARSKAAYLERAGAEGQKVVGLYETEIKKVGN